MDSNNTLIQRSSLNYETSFFAKVYGFMSFGLLTSFISAAILYFLVAQNLISSGVLMVGMIVTIILQLVVVFALSGFAHKLNALFAFALFTFGLITMNYEIGSVISAFLVAFLTFAVMSVVGVVVKRDLTTLGGFLMFGLIGVILGTVINLILSFLLPGLSSVFSWILTYVGLGIFIALVAVDTQRLKLMAAEAENKGISSSSLAIQGALMLYLDFINIFIRLLAIFGRRD
jgi:FtsH-binding integral membrane protein